MMGMGFPPTKPSEDAGRIHLGSQQEEPQPWLNHRKIQLEVGDASARETDLA
jgi:hypothetical protein